MNRTKEELESIIRRDRRAVLLVNAGSRRGAAFFPVAQRLLQQAGFVLDASTAVRGRAELATAVESALQSRPAMVVVGSGDGAVSAVVDQLYPGPYRLAANGSLAVALAAGVRPVSAGGADLGEDGTLVLQ